MSESITYVRAYCCNEDCYAIDYDTECWGETEVITEEYSDDDHWWIHACKGHQDYYNGGDYIEEEE